MSILQQDNAPRKDEGEWKPSAWKAKVKRISRDNIEARYAPESEAASFGFYIPATNSKRGRYAE
jgi:hypothetical protein